MCFIYPHQYKQKRKTRTCELNNLEMGQVRVSRLSAGGSRDRGARH